MAERWKCIMYHNLKGAKIILRISFSNYVNQQQHMYLLKERNFWIWTSIMACDFWVTYSSLSKMMRSANTALKMKIFIKDFFCKSDQIRSFLRIWSCLLRKSLMENLIFLQFKLHQFPKTE